jgi:SAM-dependent methyltransferase
MPGSDRDKWNSIHGACADSAPGAPCEVLADHAVLLPPAGHALDVCCGRGRNALFLAARGLDTSAWDISPIALHALAEAARDAGLCIAVAERDVVGKPPEPESFDVIVVSRFLDRGLCPRLGAAIRPGGLIFYQTFLRDAPHGVGPRHPEYRLAAGELPRLFPALLPISYREDLSAGEAMLVARRQSD